MQRITIEVRYSCAGCGLYRAVTTVPARGDEDVLVWVEQVMARAIAEDHAARSPHCMSREMSEVMIPMTGTDKVGGAVLN